MKTIKYMGREYGVPDWAKFIATDEDGDIYVYETMPHPEEDACSGYWEQNKGQVMLLGNTGFNWQETLVEIEE